MRPRCCLGSLTHRTKGADWSKLGVDRAQTGGENSPRGVPLRHGLPGRRPASHVKDRFEDCFGVDGSVATEPSCNLHAGYDVHAHGCLLHDDVVGVHRDDDALHVNREAACRSEQLRGPGSLVTAVPDVGLSVSVDHERVAADPDLRARVMLGVEGEDPAWPDDQVIDVRAAVTDWDGMQRPPARIFLRQFRQTCRDPLLSVGTDAPSALVGVNPKRPSQQRLHRSGFSRSQCLLAGLGSWRVGRQVDPGAGDRDRRGRLGLAKACDLGRGRVAGRDCGGTDHLRASRLPGRHGVPQCKFVARGLGVRVARLQVPPADLRLIGSSYIQSVVPEAVPTVYYDV